MRKYIFTCYSRRACSRTIGGGFSRFAVMHQCIGASSKSAISVRPSRDDLSALETVRVPVLSNIYRTLLPPCVYCGELPLQYARVHMYAPNRITVKHWGIVDSFPTIDSNLCSFFERTLLRLARIVYISFPVIKSRGDLFDLFKK